MQMRKEILEITSTQQNADSNLLPVQIGVQPKSKCKGKDGKDARIESSEKVKDDDRRKCYYCREAGHAKSQSRTRLKDLTDAEWKPVTANSRPSSRAVDAPLADDHVTTFLVTVPYAKRYSSCARVKVETTMSSDAGSTAPTGSERVKLICDSNVRNMSDDRRMCGRRHLSKMIWSNRTERYNGGINAIRDSTG